MQITTAATEWVARLDRGLSPEERAALDRWIATDIRHAGALARAQALWVHSNRLQVLSGQSPESTAPRSLSHGSRRWRWAWVAGFLLLVGAAALSLGRYTRTHFTTALGEIRRIALVDGSSVTLDTQSRIALDYTSKTRIVRLASGEALFEVAHDEMRPFIVEAGAVRVRAVGTAFLVRRDADSQVQVTVTRGVVDVWRQGEITEPAVRLAADKRVVATPSALEPIVKLTEAEVTRSTSWQDGILDLEGRTLQEAAAEFNRYNEQVLVIDDPMLARQAVVGRFHTSDPKGFAQAAAAMLDAQVHIEPDRIVLERRRLQ